MKATHTDKSIMVERIDIDSLINNAKKHPRDINKVLEQVKSYATLDLELIESYFYFTKSDLGDNTVQGMTVRMAELIVESWGNLSIQTQIIRNDGRTITALGICHDLETNLTISAEITRIITTKDAEEITATSNATSSIAFRNVVFKVIPKVVTFKIVNEIKALVIANINADISRPAIIADFATLKIKEDDILKYLNVKKLADINSEEIFILRSLKNAIKDGKTTIEQAFGIPKKKKTIKKGNQPIELP